MERPGVGPCAWVCRGSPGVGGWGMGGNTDAPCGIRTRYRPVRPRALRQLSHLTPSRLVQGTAGQQEDIYRRYLANTAFINNWDLVDVSAPHIVGPHLQATDRAPLYALARSAALWERRIAMLATFHYIRRGDVPDCLAIAEILVRDPHDLIHKAVGWMLREAAKRDPPAAEQFLRRHYRAMPRTMLRYAIEKFPEGRRQAYLKGTVRAAAGEEGGEGQGPGGKRRRTGQ